MTKLSATLSASSSSFAPAYTLPQASYSGVPSMYAIPSYPSYHMTSYHVPHMPSMAVPVSVGMARGHDGSTEHFTPSKSYITQSGQEIEFLDCAVNIPIPAFDEYDAY